MIGDIRHAQDRTEGKRLMRSHHSILIEANAGSGLASMEAFAVPGSDTVNSRRNFAELAFGTLLGAVFRLRYGSGKLNADREESGDPEECRGKHHAQKCTAFTAQPFLSC